MYAYSTPFMHIPDTSHRHPWSPETMCLPCTWVHMPTLADEASGCPAWMRVTRIPEVDLELCLPPVCAWQGASPEAQLRE